MIGKQPWLDGVPVDQEHVRQYVAMPLGQGYTVEGQVISHCGEIRHESVVDAWSLTTQITGQEKHGGLQFEYIPPFCRDFTGNSVRDR